MQIPWEGSDARRKRISMCGVLDNDFEVTSQRKEQGEGKTSSNLRGNNSAHTP